MVIKYEMETMEEIDWAEMWRKSLEESSWGQRAEKPKYWDERVDQFEGVIKQSNREEKLRAYLSENLVEEDGMLALKQKLKTAMIWWRKEYENNELKGGEKERCV